MEKWLYVMQIKRGKSYNKITKAVITKHENLRELDDNGKLELCGVFKGYPGVAGMVILKAQSYEEAEALCKLEPLVALGYATYSLHALQVADKKQLSTVTAGSRKQRNSNQKLHSLTRSGRIAFCNPPCLLKYYSANF